jgi:hypothetical protein
MPMLISAPSRGGRRVCARLSDSLSVLGVYDLDSNTCLFWTVCVLWGWERGQLAFFFFWCLDTVRYGTV